MLTVRLTFIAAFSVLALSFAGCAMEPGDVAAVDEALRVDCSLVRCALPLCAEGQHLQQNGNSCCPTCVGRPTNDRCATVLCAAVMCAEGEERVHHGPNDCCGTCQPVNPAAECRTDADCPQIYCFACPCPVSQCDGNQCVQTTPDESTCGAL